MAGDSFRRYGGNTTCFEVEVEPGHHLIIDCGTGLRGLQRQVKSSPPRRYSVLLTHYHWDHIQGLPVFFPLFSDGNEVTFHGPRSSAGGVRETLDQVMRPPWWPVSLAETGAEVQFRDLDGPLTIGGISIRHASGSHPQGVTAFRIEGPERAIVVATDHEAGNAEADARITALALGADVLIHDAQYTPEETRTIRKGWGHSSYEAAVRVAQDAGVGHLVLTSHDPDRTDEQIDRLRAMARAMFPKADAAFEGMRIPL